MSCILKDTILLLLMAAITELQVGYPVLVPFPVADVGVLKHKLKLVMGIVGEGFVYTMKFQSQISGVVPEVSLQWGN
jgi:hypothetical protein